MTSIAPFLLVFSTLLIQLASGINYVTIPLILNDQENNNVLIGVAMSFEILAAVLLYNQLSKVIQRLGVLKSLVAFSLLRALSVTFLSFNEYYSLWLLGMFGYGLATTMLLVLMQTWLNIIVTGKIKGVVMGLYSSALSSGVALGPLLLRFSNFSLEERLQFNGMVCLIPMLILFPLSLRQKMLEITGVVRLGFAFRHAKTILIAALIGGISFYGLPNFLTLYGIESGLSSEQAPLLMTMFMLGSVFLGMVISSSTIYLDRQKLVLCCVFCSVVCGVFLSLAVFSNYIAGLGILFIWGGCMGGVYAISLSVIGERFSRSEQMSVNMTYTLMDSLGGMLGLVLIGLSMDMLGAEGMSYVIVAAGCTFLVYFVRQIISKDKVFN